MMPSFCCSPRQSASLYSDSVDTAAGNNNSSGCSSMHSNSPGFTSLSPSSMNLAKPPSDGSLQLLNPSSVSCTPSGAGRDASRNIRMLAGKSLTIVRRAKLVAFPSYKENLNKLFREAYLRMCYSVRHLVPCQVMDFIDDIVIDISMVTSVSPDF